MRIIAGSARGKKLASFKGNATRPTSDRVREALFSILYSASGDLTGKKVLDLFAGSGAVAIEALSRGAVHAWLVEKSPSALVTIQKNLISCRLSDHATVIARDAWKALPHLLGDGPFDIIFIDPPYHSGQALSMLKALSEHELLAWDGLLAVETAANERLPEDVNPFKKILNRQYGSAALHFYSMPRQDRS